MSRSAPFNKPSSCFTLLLSPVPLPFYPSPLPSLPCLFSSSSPAALLVYPLLLSHCFPPLPSSPLFPCSPPSYLQQVLGELLCEGQAVSVCVSGLSGQGGQWLARLHQIMLEGAMPTVCLVPVGISYDCVPQASTKVLSLQTHILIHTPTHTPGVPGVWSFCSKMCSCAAGVCCLQ